MTGIYLLRPSHMATIESDCMNESTIYLYKVTISFIQLISIWALLQRTEHNTRNFMPKLTNKPHLLVSRCVDCGKFWHPFPNSAYNVLLLAAKTCWCHKVMFFQTIDQRNWKLAVNDFCFSNHNQSGRWNGKSFEGIIWCDKLILSLNN